MSNSSVGGRWRASGFTVDALVSDLAEDDVVEVGFTVHSSRSWSLWAKPGDRIRTDSIRVRLPGASVPNWPLPATLRDGADLQKTLVTLARMLGTAPPVHDLEGLGRFPRPIEITKHVRSDVYLLWVAGWGRETLALSGDSVRLVDDLVRLFQPARDGAPRPLRSLEDLADVYESLMVDLGRRWAIRWAEPLPVPGGVRLPSGVCLTVGRKPGAEPSLQVTAEELLVEADHPGHSLRERFTLLLCPQLYRSCVPEDLAEWLRGLGGRAR